MRTSTPAGWTSRTSSRRSWTSTQTIDVEERNEKIRNVQTLLTEEMWYVPGVGWQISWEAYQSWVNVPDAHFFGRGGGGFTGLYEQLWLEK